jgi:transcriptional regulator GlxA family with amidase domain
MRLPILILLSLSTLTCYAQKINTAFVVVDGVFNSELIAPLDILQHSKYRNQENYFYTFVVTPDGKPVRTAEDLTIHADYSFTNCPDVDVLIIPSTEHSMGKDLENKVYMDWIKAKVQQAKAVMSLCDGAFPLAATGALDGLQATTFPGDQDAFEKKFPQIAKVHRNVWFVQDGKFITSVGGAKSYEPALYLTHLWFGEDIAKRTAQGLVIDWDLTKIPHKTFGKAPPKP